MRRLEHSPAADARNRDIRCPPNVIKEEIWLSTCHAHLGTGSAACRAPWSVPSYETILTGDCAIGSRCEITTK